jgi:hypothetical protein
MQTIFVFSENCFRYLKTILIFLILFFNFVWFFTDDGKLKWDIEKYGRLWVQEF